MSNFSREDLRKFIDDVERANFGQVQVGGGAFGGTSALTCWADNQADGIKDTLEEADAVKDQGGCA